MWGEQEGREGRGEALGEGEGGEKLNGQNGWISIGDCRLDNDTNPKWKMKSRVSQGDERAER